MYLRLSYLILAVLTATSIAHGFTIRRRGLIPMTSDHRIAQLQAHQALGGEVVKVPAGFGVRDPQLLGRRRRALSMVPRFIERITGRQIYDNENPGESIILLRLRSPQIWR